MHACMHGCSKVLAAVEGAWTMDFTVEEMTRSKNIHPKLLIIHDVPPEAATCYMRINGQNIHLKLLLANVYLHQF